MEPSADGFILIASQHVLQTNAELRSSCFITSDDYCDDDGAHVKLGGA